jgi:hypothetical protein
VYPKLGYVDALVYPGQYFALLTKGYRVEVDAERTAQLSQLGHPLPNQVNGIPGFPCYRTVEETYATAQSIVAAHPTLAQWIDIGDSWDKVTPGGPDGYDIMVLKLANQTIPGPKPKLFIMSSIHAREYTPAELNTRFAEYLVNNYDVDPDITALLDYNEVHLLLQANPDGRKQAEAGYLWRKNTNQNYCGATSTDRGADLNRNFPFYWNSCNPIDGCSSGLPCNETYRGPSAASESETQAVVDYVRSQYPDLRSDDLGLAAPITTSGVFMDLHSYSQLVLWPWGFTPASAPNGTALQTLGRKFAYFNNYTPQQSIGLYPTDGTTDDFAYGELGVPAYTIEMGVDFFESCTTFENTTAPANMPALLYALKSARRPYQTPGGPDTLSVGVTPTSTVSGGTITLTAVANDTRFNNSNGTEPTQNIAAARYSIDVPSWITGTVTYPLGAADGAFNNPIESLQATVSLNGLSIDRHFIFVESQDAAGNWGAPTAVFVQVNIVPDSYLAGHVVTQGSGTPIEGATVTASAGPTATFSTISNVNGAYDLAVLTGNYTLTASQHGYQTATLNGVIAYTGLTTTQDITLTQLPLPIIAPATMTQTGESAAALYYGLQVTNTDVISHVFDVVVSGRASGPTNVGPIPPQGGIPLTITVYNPPYALGNETSVANVTVQAHDNPALSATAVLTAIVTPHWAVGLAPAIQSQTGVTGTTLMYQVYVINQGNVSDTYTLTLGANQWPTSLSLTQTLVTVTPRYVIPVEFTAFVSIPVTATPGTTDTVRIIATGTGDSAYADLTTTAVATKIYLPIIRR